MVLYAEYARLWCFDNQLAARKNWKKNLTKLFLDIKYKN